MADDGGYRLPVVNNPSRFCVTLQIPKDVNHCAAFVGALIELTKWWNWERDSGHGAIAAAMVWQNVLSALVGQIDYSNPTIGDACDMPTQFRLEAECGLEYSNDGGETWNAVEGWDVNAAACFTGPPGEPGEPGEPGVVTAQLVRVGGDTPPDFTYTPETQTLTATLQEQWFRGIRVIPATVPAGLAGHKIEVNTYDDPDTWSFLGWIPSNHIQYEVAPPYNPEPVPLTESEAICLAAWNAAEVMARTYDDIAPELVNPNYDEPLEILRLIFNTVGGLLIGDEVVPSNLIDVAGILAFIGVKAAFYGETWGETEKGFFREQLIINATWDAASGAVAFDHDAIKSWLGVQYDNGANGQYGLMNFLIFFLGNNVLNIGANAAYYIDPTALDCSNGFRYAVNFLEEPGLWVSEDNGAGVAERVDGFGWISSDGSGGVRGLRIMLDTPGGFDPDLTIKRVAVIYSVSDGIPNESATDYQLGHLYLLGLGDAPNQQMTPGEDSPYGETDRLFIFDHPGFTGVFSIWWEMFATAQAPEINVKRMYVYGDGDSPYE